MLVLVTQLVHLIKGITHVDWGSLAATTYSCCCWPRDARHVKRERGGFDRCCFHSRPRCRPKPAIVCIPRIHHLITLEPVTAVVTGSTSRRRRQRAAPCCHLSSKNDVYPAKSTHPSSPGTSQPSPRRRRASCGNPLFPGMPTRSLIDGLTHMIYQRHTRSEHTVVVGPARRPKNNIAAAGHLVAFGSSISVYQ